MTYTTKNLPGLAYADLRALKSVPSTVYRVAWGDPNADLPFGSGRWFLDAEPAQAFYNSLTITRDGDEKSLESWEWDMDEWEVADDAYEVMATGNINTVTNRYGESFDITEFSGLFDKEITEYMDEHVPYYNAQQWFDRYCAMHAERFDEPFVLDTAEPQF
jgi:hypothetical protein